MTKQITHSEMVKRLVKSPYDMVATVAANPLKMDLIHAILGISGEAGELLDTIKKHVIYNKELDRDNIIEELGDLEFYIEQLRQNLDISREECIQHNIQKLSVRYKNFQYSDQQAHDRKDKITT